MSGTETKETPIAAEVLGKSGGIITDSGIDHPDLSGEGDKEVNAQVVLISSALNKMWENDKEIFMQKFIDNILSSIKEDTRAAIKEYVNEAIDENLKALTPEVREKVLKELVDRSLSKLSPDKVQEILKADTKVPTDDEKEKATAAADEVPAAPAASGDEKLENVDEKNAKTTAAASDTTAASAPTTAAAPTDPTADAPTAVSGEDAMQAVTDPQAAADKVKEEAAKKAKEMTAKALGAVPGGNLIAGFLKAGARTTRRRKSKITKRRKQTKHRRQTMKR